MSQPIRVPVPVTIASGVATATFPSPPMGTVWTGSISVPKATSGTILNVTWQAATGGAPLSGWYNDQPSGSVQVASGDTITIVGTGLAAGTYTAWLIGVQDPAAAAPAVWPQPPPPPPPVGSVTLHNDAALVARPSGTTTIVSGVPVIPGQSVLISLAVDDTAPMRFTASWETGISFTFDLQTGNSLKGLILENLGTLLTIQLTNSASYSANLSVYSGDFGPARGPVMPEGVITFVNGEVLAAGQSVNGYNIPPFCGPASIWAEPCNVPGVGITIVGSDYLGNVAWESRVSSASSGPGPQFDTQSIVYLPPLILSLNMNNNSAANQTIYFSASALTP